jgi:hypothetical protein
MGEKTHGVEHRRKIPVCKYKIKTVLLLIIYHQRAGEKTTTLNHTRIYILVYGTGISVLYRRYHQKQEKERKKNTQKEGKKSMRFWQVYGTEILSFYTIVVFLFATVRKKEN